MFPKQILRHFGLFEEIHEFRTAALKDYNLFPIAARLKSEKYNEPEELYGKRRQNPTGAQLRAHKRRNISVILKTFLFYVTGDRGDWKEIFSRDAIRLVNQRIICLGCPFEFMPSFIWDCK